MNDSRADAGGLLREVARLYTRAQRVEADCCSTTPTQCHVLTELGRSGPLPMNELGQRLLLEKSWVSRAVDGLVALALVNKRANPDDARSWIVALTPAGKRRVNDLNATLDRHAQALLYPLGERERESVHRALLLLLKALRQDKSATCCLPPSRRPKKPRPNHADVA
ncbi:MAG TPA: MarR family transcriptional regulator [Albitalea sp.]